MHKLSTQYRMLPEIREFPSDQFYGGELRDGPGVLKQNYREWHECKLYKPFVFYDVQHGKEESSSSGFSWINEEEAAFAIELAHQLLKANPVLKRGGPKVAIISPYRAQVSVIRRKLEKKFGGECTTTVRPSRYYPSIIHKAEKDNPSSTGRATVKRYVSYTEKSERLEC